MPRKIAPLSPTHIAKAAIKDKEYNLSDGNGLMLRVKPNGTKSWIFNYYRPITKKRSNIGIGRYPKIGLDKARKKRSEFLELLAQGIDPKEYRDSQEQLDKQAAANTFQVVATRWIEIQKSRVKEKTASDTWLSLERHVFPKLGSIPIHLITAPKGIAVLNTLITHNHYEMARKVARRMNKIMTYAVNEGSITANPLHGIKEVIPASPVRRMPTIAPNELPELMRALSIANIHVGTRCLIEWQLHTMVRPGEAAGTKWSEIDFEKALWRIPEARMKMKKEHIVPLSEQALSLLSFMRPISGMREYVFPSRKNPRHPANKESANMALKRMGFHGRLVAHGMRALASTTLNEQGFDKDVIEAALAHGDRDEVRAAYNRATYLEQRRTMMDWWSAHIVKASAGNSSLSSSLGD
tara:strand:+ start:3484 stop:4713 length:1230 start_codon:yes stop_codon:yes gene_type:complete